MLEDIWFYLAIMLGVTTVASLVLFLIERERKRSLEDEMRTRGPTATRGVQPAGRSVPDEVVKEVKSRLRVLDVEREILSYAVRRLYEAQAEGKITPEERDALARKYREDLERVKEEIARGETIVAIGELERMREEFIKTFSERLEMIDKRIEELKALIKPRPIEQIAKPAKEEISVEGAKEQAQVREERAERPPTQRRRRESIKAKTAEEAAGEVREEPERAGEVSDADKSIERIVAEIEKVLSRLSQIEAEG